jgi:hypothetical protein
MKRLDKAVGRLGWGWGSERWGVVKEWERGERERNVEREGERERASETEREREGERERGGGEIK